MEKLHPNDAQYQRLKIAVKSEITTLVKKLVKFDKKQKLNPKDGGFGGSMGYILYLRRIEKY